MYLLFHWYNITESQRKQGMHPELHKKLMTEAEIESTFGLKTLCSFAHITHFPNCIPLKYMWMLLFILYTWITWIWIFYFKCCQLSKSETSAQITRKKSHCTFCTDMETLIFYYLQNKLPPIPFITHCLPDSTSLYRGMHSVSIMKWSISSGM